MIGLGPGVSAALGRRGDRIILTGASGWIGRATLAFLADVLGETVQDRVLCFGSSARMVPVRDGLALEQRSLDELGRLSAAPSLMLHLAFPTKDRVAGMTEEHYIATCRALSETVEAALGPVGVTSLFVPSSGAAARADDPAAGADMRLYGRMKRDDERRFAAWAAGARATAVIARVFNLSGPYINKFETYALSSFIVDALDGRAIRIAAARPVVRSYVGIAELMTLVFALLLEGDGRTTIFDTAGDEALEMGELAALVRHAVAPAITIERAPITDAGANEYVGERAPYQSLLARHDIRSTPIGTQIAETAGYIARTLGRPGPTDNAIGTPATAC